MTDKSGSKKIVINSRYTVVKALGGGSQGRVYKVIDRLAPDRETALKILNAGAPGSLLRFEFEQLSKLDHPHIVKVFDLGFIEKAEGDDSPPVGSAFFTQEFVPGEPAGGWVEKIELKEREKKVAEVGVAVARALAFLHGRGLLHRDVKPSNILVGMDGDPVKLIDLGLSRMTAQWDGLKAGTLGYIAPEALGGYPDERSDLYGLGVALTELSTGKISQLGVPAAIDRPEHISEKLWKVLKRLVEQRPERRFQSAKETVLALAKAVGADILGPGRESELIDAASESENEATRTARARSAELIGRSRELGLARDWLEQALKKGRGAKSVAVIAGPPGVGKTRLFKTAVIEAELSAAKSGKVIPTLRAGALREIVGSLAKGEAPGNWPVVKGWLSGKQVQQTTSDSETDFNALVEEMARLVSGVDQPMAMLIEDGDNPLVFKLLRRLDLAQKTGGSSLLVIAAEMRDEKPAGRVSDQLGALLIELRPLDEDTEMELVKTALNREPDRNFGRELHRLTGGVPLLTESVLSALILKRKDKKLDKKSLDSLELEGDPGKIVLAGLMSGLEGPSKALVESMAAIGEPASLEETAAVAGIDEISHVVAAVSILERKGWLVRGTEERIGLPDFVSKSLARSLSPSRARELHARVFEMLQARSDSDSGLLARHAALAGLNEQARGLAKKAADARRSAGDSNGAMEQLELILSLGPTADTDEVKTRLARILRETGSYRKAIDLAKEVEKSGGKFSAGAALERAASLRFLGNVDEALDVLKNLMNASEAVVALEARALAGRMEMDGGDPAKARELIGEVEPRPDPALARSGILSVAGLAALSTGDFEKAEAMFEAGLKAAEQMGDSRYRARFFGLMGMLHHARNDWKSALASYGAALKLADSNGDRHGAATYAVNMAAAHTELDQVAEALECYRDGIERLRRVGRPIELSGAEANYALLLLRVGDMESADAASSRAVANAEPAAESAAAAFALRTRGDVLMVMGRTEKAEKLLTEAESLAQKAEAVQELVVCRHLLAESAMVADKAENAEAWLDKAELAGALTGQQTSIEHRRLRLELAGLGIGDRSQTLAALLDALPLKKGRRRAWHLKAFAAAARAAMEEGETESAGQAAQAALELVSAVSRATPSLHRQSESPLVREMESIRKSASGFTESWSQASKVASEDWQRLIRIDKRLNSELRVGRLLELIMDTAIDFTDAERGFLLIADSEGVLKVRCARNIDKQSLEEESKGFSRSVAIRAFTSGDVVLTTDAQEDERFQSMRSVVDLNLRYIAAAPLQVKGRIIGAVYVDSRGGARFGEDRMILLKALAEQAAIALTNARLTVENRRRQRRIEKLNKELESKLQSNRGELEQVKDELEKRTDVLVTRYEYEGIVARSSAMAEVFRLLDRVVESFLPVVVEGESGTGKELIARALHFKGPRKRGPFVAENCAAIPETLLESVLFGHVKGAFTGAVKDSRGLFVEADGGTLFLDEVSAMSLAMQVKLLRVLQDGEVRPVGGSKTTKVDVRIVVASNANLADMVKRGVFREDLYYRLSVIILKLPALRDRKEDIPLLAEHFAKKHGKDSTPKISSEAMEALIDYPWPGNVRQLENEMMRAIVLSAGNVELNHLSEEVISGVSQFSELSADLNMNRQVERMKRRLISLALKRTGGNQTAAAELLGLSRFGLQKMIARFDS